jgi:exopolyphosphatase/guanosine-5'-triphosphate,3'-diphosphate pyrophosphatase
MLRLGEEVGSSTRFSEASIRRSVEVIRHFRSIAEAVGCSEFTVCATAAFREAENCEEMVNAIESATGLKVSVISGYREAELIYLAIRSALPIGTIPVVTADLGGGSLEMSVGDQWQQYCGASLRLGVGRLISKFPHSDPLRRSEREAIQGYVREHLEPFVRRIVEFQPNRLVVSSGSLNAIVALAAEERQTQERRTFDAASKRSILEVSTKDILALSDLISRSGPEERLRHPNIDEKRNDQLPIGYLVLCEILEMSGLDTVLASPWAMREGIVLDALAQRSDFEFTYDVDQLRLGSIQAVAQRFLSSTAHVEHVASIVGQLGASLGERLHLDSADLDLLHCAAHLHDIGEAISQDGHDRHSAYLVEAVELRGFTAEERAILSTLVRYHKKGSPKLAEHRALGAIRPQRRERIPAQLALLRVADALDRAHQGNVTGVTTEVTEDSVTLIVVAENDVTHEVNGVRKKGSLLESVLGRSLRVDVVGEESTINGGSSGEAQSSG